MKKKKLKELNYEDQSLWKSRRTSDKTRKIPPIHGPNEIVFSDEETLYRHNGDHL